MGNSQKKLRQKKKKKERKYSFLTPQGSRGTN